MPQLEVKLPSGARGRVRGLKGEEINLFANRNATRRGKTSLQILQNIWVETLEEGSLYADGKIDWKNAPQCDRFTALFWARIATYGKEYAFKYQCNADDCRKRYEWVLDLEEDLEHKELPEESAKQFLDGNRFTTAVVDPTGKSRSVIYQLLTPKLEGKIEQVQGLAPKERATAALAQRIVSIEGVEQGKGPLKTFLNDLDAGPLFDLVHDMDDVDGGVETQIEIECPHCGNIEEVDLPLDEFWSPPKRRRSTSS